MEYICPIDATFPDRVAALLKPPSPREVQEYFDQLVSEQGCGLKVEPNHEFGKGVCSEMSYGEGDLVLKEQTLFGIQNTSNKLDCLVCSFCFRFIGSVELQIGRKLYFEDLHASKNKDSGRQMHSHSLQGCCGANSFDNEDNSCTEYSRKVGQCSSSYSTNKIPLSKKVIELIMNGELILPYSKEFLQPSVISCPGGCAEAYYCSMSCAKADWDTSHSLLCLGERSKSTCKEALANFLQHARETNDIFLLSSKAISFTILKYRKLKEVSREGKEKTTTSGVLDDSNFSLILEAWKPVSMAYKRRWWDCIALPQDVDCNHEISFRKGIRDLAFESLQLLKAAIFDIECEPLFSLEIYGNIIGMFELNNLGLVVASPVQDYFLYIDDLPRSKKARAEETTGPFLDALGEGYSDFCEGTAFYPIQSCFNHSCCPNATAFKRQEDRDGQATIIALRPISKGEEVTISYIEEDLPYKERQVLLADYGFRCRCKRCLEEEA